MAQRPACVHLSIVSSSRLLRDGLAALLTPRISMCLVGSYAGEEMSLGGQANPADHVVLLDSGVGGSQAVAWTTWWRSQMPAAGVIVIELANDIELICALIEAGAGGYILRGASVIELVDAIENIRRGAAHCTPEVTAQLFARLAALGSKPTQPAPGVGILTRRELEVLRFIAEDCSNNEIAALLTIEVRTVKHHVHNILEKLKLHHRWDAARLAVEQGWLVAGEPQARTAALPRAPWATLPPPQAEQL